MAGATNVVTVGWLRKKRQRRWCCIAGGSLHWFVSEVSVDNGLGSASPPASNSSQSASFCGPSALLRRHAACRGVLPLDPTTVQVSGVFSSSGRSSSSTRLSFPLNLESTQQQQQQKLPSSATPSETSVDGVEDESFFDSPVSHNSSESSTTASFGPMPSSGSRKFLRRKASRALPDLTSKTSSLVGFCLTGSSKGDYSFECVQKDRFERSRDAARWVAAIEAALQFNLHRAGEHQEVIRLPLSTRSASTSFACAAGTGGDLRSKTADVLTTEGSPVPSTPDYLTLPSSLVSVMERYLPVHKVAAQLRQSKPHFSFLGEDGRAWEKQGYLMKKGKKRFFRLSGSYLLWHTSDIESDFRGSLFLAGCTVENRGGGTLLLCQPTGAGPSRLYELLAKSPDQAQDWTDRLQAVIRDSAVTLPQAFEDFVPVWPTRCKFVLRVNGKVLSMERAFISTAAPSIIKAEMLTMLMFQVHELFSDNLRQSLPRIPSGDHFFLKLIGVSEYYLLDEDAPIAADPVINAMRRSFVSVELEMHPKKLLLEQSGSVAAALKGNADVFDPNVFVLIDADIRSLITAPLTENSVVRFDTPMGARDRLLRYSSIGSQLLHSSTLSPYEVELQQAIITETLFCINKEYAAPMYLARFAEAISFRKRMAACRLQLTEHVVRKICRQPDRLWPEYLEEAEPTLQGQAGVRIFLNIRFPSAATEETASTKIEVNDWSCDTVSSIIDIALVKFSKWARTAEAEAAVSNDCILKFVGKRSFAASPQLPIGCFRDVVRVAMQARKTANDGGESAAPHVLVDMLLCFKTQLRNNEVNGASEMHIFDVLLARDGDDPHTESIEASAVSTFPTIRIGVFENIRIRNLYDSGRIAGESESAQYAVTDVDTLGEPGTAGDLWPSDLAAATSLSADGAVISTIAVVDLFHGGQRVCKPIFSRPACFVHTIIPGRHRERNSVTFDQSLALPLSLQSLPRAVLLRVTLFARIEGSRQVQRSHANTSALPSDIASGSEALPPGYCAVSYVTLSLFDHNSQFRSGEWLLKMWNSSKDGDATFSFTTCCENYLSAEPTCVALSIEALPDERRVKHSLSACSDIIAEEFLVACVDRIGRIIERQNGSLPITSREAEQVASAPTPVADGVARAVEGIVSRDALASISRAELQILWHYRHELCTSDVQGKSLPKFLMSVDWLDPGISSEGIELLRRWSMPSIETALELLDRKFSDLRVREYAVRVLACRFDPMILQHSTIQLSTILLQLVQALKHELDAFNALWLFLYYRSMLDSSLGVKFLWFLRSEMHRPELTLRFGLYVEALVRGLASSPAGDGITVIRSLAAQGCILDALTEVSLLVKQADHDGGRVARERMMGDQLSFLSERFPSPYVSIPLFPERELIGLQVDKCKVMQSKKLPLWLVFEQSEAQQGQLTATTTVIYKVGDDLRQDQLTLQMISLMDSIWKSNGLDMRMSLYAVVATGDGVGLLEVVLNSDTTANINREAGGATKVLRDDVMTSWLAKKNASSSAANTLPRRGSGRENNVTDSASSALDVENEERTDPALPPVIIENFARSVAGYCVATYVLGIGDRHNDNVMLSFSGCLFHIDFGHFLGNYKKKLGMDREKAPFVFTPQFAHVLGRKNSTYYQDFESLAATAFNLVRRNGNLFVSLFSLMLSVGLEELKSVDNIEFLRERLQPSTSEAEAADLFHRLIESSLATKRQQMMDLVHILAN